MQTRNKPIENSEVQIGTIVDKLRQDLASIGIAFGALFIGANTSSGSEFGFVFSSGMPQAIRMELLKDMQTQLNRSKARFGV